MSAAQIEIGAAFAVACIIALFVVPTALASLFGAQWLCMQGSLLFVAVTFVLLMVATYLRSRES